MFITKQFQVNQNIHIHVISQMKNDKNTITTNKQTSRVIFLLNMIGLFLSNSRQKFQEVGLKRQKKNKTNKL